METFNNQCPFCSSRELGSGTFVFNNVKYSIVCCKSCAKVIVSVKDEAEKQIQELIKEIERMKKVIKEIERMKELMHFKYNSDI